MALVQINIVHCSRKGRPKGLMLTVSWNYPYFIGIIKWLIYFSAQAHRLALVGFVYMIKFFQKNPIENEILEYVESRHGVIGHNEYLQDFKRYSQIKGVVDITYEIIEKYRQHKIETTTNFTSIRAMQVIRCFIRHHKSKTHIIANHIQDVQVLIPVGESAIMQVMIDTKSKKVKLGRPRNEEAIKKVRILKDQGGLTFRAISLAMNKDVKTVFSWYQQSFDEDLLVK